MTTDTQEKPSIVDVSATSKTLSQMLDETARQFPNRIVLITTESQMTYAEFRARVLKAAAAFKSRGVNRGDCVSIIHRNSPDYVVTYFALARLGAVAVPINFMVQKAAELQYMLADCAAVGIVTQREFLKGILEAKKTLPALKSIWSTDSSDAETNVESFRDFVDRAQPLEPAEAPAKPQDTCAILYTSGTTGSPKGVMLTHSNLISNCEASIRLIGITKKDVLLCILPMFHSFAWTACVLIPIRLGLKVVVSASITPAKPWLAMMGRYGVSVFAAVPPVYAVLAKEVSGFKGLIIKYWFFRRVRFGVSGAAPLSVEVAKAFQNKLGVPILEGYGLTETSPVATINPPNDPRIGSVGKPIDGVRIKIVSDDEKPLATGEEGEVCIQGPNVMKGYHKLPEATREAFTKDGWFKTGDIGVVDDDGYLYLRDRKKDMIIVKGLKVFSAQVEQVISTHPDVEEAAIVGVPDDAGNEVIKAFIVLRKGAATDKAALMQFCRTKLDAYKRPRDIEIVDALPKNALQKVLKRVLRQKELDKKK